MEQSKLELHHVNKISDDELVYIFKTEIKEQEYFIIDFIVNEPFNYDNNNVIGINIKTSQKLCCYYFFDFKQVKRQKLGFIKALEQFFIGNADKIYVYEVDKAIKYLYFMFHTFFKIQDIKAYCIIDGHKELTFTDLCKNLNINYNISLELQNEKQSYENLFNNFELKQVIRAIQRGKSSNSILNNIIQNAKDTEILKQRLQTYWKTSGCYQHFILIKQSCCKIYALVEVFNYLKQSLDFDSLKETYKVYLNNQYLLAVNNLSGVYIDRQILNDIEQNLLAIKVNVQLALNRYSLFFKVQNANDLKPELQNQYVNLLISKYHSQMFLIEEMIPLGKEFYSLYKEQPSILPDLFSEHLPEVQTLIASLNNLETKDKEVYSAIGKFLYADCKLSDWHKQLKETGITIESVQEYINNSLLKQKFDILTDVLVARDIDSPLNNRVIELYQQSLEELDKVIIDEIITKYCCEDLSSNQYVNFNRLILDTDNLAIISQHIERLWNIYAAANKVLNTSIKNVKEYSYNIDRIGATFCTAIQGDKQEGYKAKYFNNAKANSCKSNRWTCRDHSMLTEAEDVRAAMLFRMGDQFIIESDIYEPIQAVYELDGYLFRPFDFVKLTNGDYILAKNAKENEEIDKTWLSRVLYENHKKTKDIIWQVAYLKG